MSSRWWGWFPQPQQPWLKETLSKDGKLFQFTPDTSWKPSTHNQPSHLDQNGRSFNSPPHSVAGSFTSNAHTFLWLSRSFPSSVCCFSPGSFFFPQALVLFPPLSLLSPLAVCQGFTSKLMIGFLTVQQAVFYPALCEETKIISMNMEKNLLVW